MSYIPELEDSSYFHLNSSPSHLLSDDTILSYGQSSPENPMPMYAPMFTSPLGDQQITETVSLQRDKEYVQDSNLFDRYEIHPNVATESSCDKEISQWLNIPILTETETGNTTVDSCLPTSNDAAEWLHRGFIAPNGSETRVVSSSLQFSKMASEHQQAGIFKHLPYEATTAFNNCSTSSSHSCLNLTQDDTDSVSPAASFTNPYSWRNANSFQHMAIGLPYSLIWSSGSHQHFDNLFTSTPKRPSGINFHHNGIVTGSDISSSNPFASNQALSELQLGQRIRVSRNADMVELNQISPKNKRKKSTNTKENKECKRCNCKRSSCLKLYCKCFATGVYCVDSCACENCSNKPDYKAKICEVRQQIESRDPLAFAPNVMEEGNPTTPYSARHKRGCNCKKSNCLKRYCECYKANVGCSSICHCEGCQNLSA